MLRRLNEIFRSVDRGFTVTELMATMGVFVVFMAIAVPNYIALQPTRRLNGATRQVLGKLMWARAKAVEQNNPFVVQIPNNSSLLIFDDKNNNGAPDTGEWSQTVNIQSDYYDVTVAKTPGDPDPAFNSRGTTISGATTITLSNSSGSANVIVSVTGNIKIN